MRFRLRKHIRIIKSLSPRRYCTRRKPVRLWIPQWDGDLPGYIAMFNGLNNLKE